MKNRRTIHKAIFFLYLLAVGYLCFGNFSSIPSTPKDFLGIPSDKWVHFMMFFPFALLLYNAFQWRSSKWWHSLLLVTGVFAVGCLVAAGTEIGQGMTTYRSKDPQDFAADILALCLSTAVVLILDLKKTLKK